MTGSRRPSLVRVGVVLAAGFLLLDGILLVLAGVWSRTSSLMWWGALFGVASIGIVLLWRRYVRELDALDQARRAMRREALRLQSLLRERR